MTVIVDECCNPAELPVTVIVTVLAGFDAGGVDDVFVPPPPQPTNTRPQTSRLRLIGARIVGRRNLRKFM